MVGHGLVLQQDHPSAGAGDLGTSTARWKEVHTQKANVNILTFENNTISTNVSTQI